MEQNAAAEEKAARAVPMVEDDPWPVYECTPPREGAEVVEIVDAIHASGVSVAWVLEDSGLVWLRLIVHGTSRLDGLGSYDPSAQNPSMVDITGSAYLGGNSPLDIQGEYGARSGMFLVYLQGGYTTSDGSFDLWVIRGGGDVDPDYESTLCISRIRPDRLTLAWSWYAPPDAWQPGNYYVTLDVGTNPAPGPTALGAFYPSYYYGLTEEELWDPLNWAARP